MNPKIGIQKRALKLVLRVLDEVRQYYLRLILSNANLTFCDEIFRIKRESCDERRKFYFKKIF